MDAAWAPWSSWSECASCIEENISYDNEDNLNNARQDNQPDFERCQSFCKTNHTSATYFTWVPNRGFSGFNNNKGFYNFMYHGCYCKTTNSGRQERNNYEGVISGEVSCKFYGKIGKGQRGRSRVCENTPLNGGIARCQPNDIKKEEIGECDICPDGYSFKNGTPPRSISSKTSMNSTTIQECSSNCDKEGSCCSSFDYSKTDHICNLYKGCEPTLFNQYKDYDWCSKDTSDGKPIIHRN